jgi:hypothetical protein
MEKTISYHKPVCIDKTKYTLSYWYECTKLYDDKKYIPALKNLLKYMNSDIEIPDGDSIDLTLFHGSSKLKIKADQNEIYITADFLKIPDQPSKIALMRQVLELNFNYLVLSRIVIKENDLFFEFKDRIENTDPYKIFYIIDEICFCSDKHDDFFIDKFGARRVSEPKITMFTDEEKDKAYAYFKDILNQGIEYGEFYIGKRYYSSACDFLSISLMKLDYVIQPQGLLQYEIKKLVDYMFEPGRGGEEIAGETVKRMKKLLEFDKQKFYDGCYYPQYVLSPKTTTEITQLQNNLRSEYDKIKDFYSKSDFFNTCIYCAYNIYFIFYHDLVANDIFQKLDYALSQTGDMEWAKAASVLYEAITSVMNMGVSNSVRPSNTARAK